MSGRIVVGVGGWTYEPWRDTFYPKSVPKKDELSYAASVLTAIEVNGTFYRSQTPATFAKWRASVPDGFVFALKAPRFAVNRKVLAEGAESIERFMASGITELGDALGPILWQLAATKRFEPDDFAAFLDLMPPEVEGLPLRHAVEVRHETFLDPEAVAIAKKRGIAIVRAMDSQYPEVADLTADFAYLRLMGTEEGESEGYGAAALDAHAAGLKALAKGGTPEGSTLLAKAAAKKARDVYCFVIAGHKVANPAAAQALIARVA